MQCGNVASFGHRIPMNLLWRAEVVSSMVGRGQIYTGTLEPAAIIGPLSRSQTPSANFQRRLGHTTGGRRIIRAPATTRQRPNAYESHADSGVASPVALCRFPIGEEPSHICQEEVGLLESREMTACCHLGLVNNPVGLLSVRAQGRGKERVGKGGDAGWHLDVGTSRNFAGPLQHAASIHPCRGDECPVDGVQHDVGKKRILTEGLPQIRASLFVARHVGPRPELLHDPSGDADRAIRHGDAERLGTATLHLRVAVCSPASFARRAAQASSSGAFGTAFATWIMTILRCSAAMAPRCSCAIQAPIAAPRFPPCTR